LFSAGSLEPQEDIKIPVAWPRLNKPFASLRAY